MKKCILSVALVALFSVTMFAQEENNDRYPSSAGFVTNGFWSNWEIGIGAGAQFYSFTGANNHELNNYGAFKDRISPEFGLYLGKWFTPVWGIRGAVQGAWMYGITQQVDYSTLGVYFPNANVNQKGMEFFTSDRMPGLVKPSDGLPNTPTMGAGDNQRPILRHQFYYIASQAQLMCNLSAWWGGYRPKRVYNAILFGGVGAIRSLGKDDNYHTNNDWAASFGLSNRFRVHKVLDLYVDVQSLVFKDRFYNPVVTSGRSGYLAMLPSVQAGLNFRLPKQDFKRVPKCDYGPFYNQIDSLNNALSEQKDANNKLADELKNTQDSLANTKQNLANTQTQLDSCQADLAKKPKVVEKVVEKVVIQKPTEDEQQKLKDAFDNIYFNSGKATLTTQSYGPLDRSAKILKKYPKIKIKIMGHTDNVGKPATNLKLSQQRADAVRLYLIKKGVKAENIISIGYGDTQPVADNSTAEGRELNRRTVIEISE